MCRQRSPTRSFSTLSPTRFVARRPWLRRIDPLQQERSSYPCEGGDPMVRNIWRHGLVLAAAQLALTAGPAMSQSAPQQADSFSNDELVCALNPKCGAERVKIRRRGITISQPESSRRTAPPDYFNNVTFDFDSAELTNQAHSMLDRIAVAL